jgi:hypothetical protein
MDADRCDFLARSLVTSSRRRFSLALAGLGLAGGLGLPAGPVAVEGKKQRKRKRRRNRNRNQKQPTCASGEKLCGEACIPEADCCSDDDCGDPGLGLICVEGECVCGTRRGLSIQAC